MTEEMTHALISDRSIARGLAMPAAGGEESCSDALEGNAQRSLISDASIARGLRSLISDESIARGLVMSSPDCILVEESGPYGDEKSEGVEIVQGELFLDHVDEVVSDDDGGEVCEQQLSLYHVARATVANSRLAWLHSLAVSTKLARMALLLQAKHAETQQVKLSNEGSVSLVRHASTRIPHMPDAMLMDESDLFSLAPAGGSLNFVGEEPSGLSDVVTEAELCLIAQCQHPKQ